MVVGPNKIGLKGRARVRVRVRVRFGRIELSL